MDFAECTISLRASNSSHDHRDDTILGMQSAWISAPTSPTTSATSDKSASTHWDVSKASLLSPSEISEPAGSHIKTNVYDKEEFKNECSNPKEGVPRFIQDDNGDCHFSKPHIITSSPEPSFSGMHTAIAITDGPDRGKWLHITRKLSKEEAVFVMTEMFWLWNIRDNITTSEEVYCGSPASKELVAPLYKSIAKSDWKLLGPPGAPFPMTCTFEAPFAGPHTSILNCGVFFNGWYLHIPRFLTSDQNTIAQSNLGEICMSRWDWGADNEAQSGTVLKKKLAVTMASTKASQNQKIVADFLEIDLGFDFSAQDVDLSKKSHEKAVWVKRSLKYFVHPTFLPRQPKVLRTMTYEMVDPIVVNSSEREIVSRTQSVHTLDVGLNARKSTPAPEADNNMSNRRITSLLSYNNSSHPVYVEVTPSDNETLDGDTLNSNASLVFRGAISSIEPVTAIKLSKEIPNTKDNPGYSMDFLSPVLEIPGRYLANQLEASEKTFEKSVVASQPSLADLKTPQQIVKEEKSDAEGQHILGPYETQTVTSDIRNRSSIAVSYQTNSKPTKASNAAIKNIPDEREALLNEMVSLVEDIAQDLQARNKQNRPASKNRKLHDRHKKTIEKPHDVDLIEPSARIQILLGILPWVLYMILGCYHNILNWMRDTSG